MTAPVQNVEVLFLKIFKVAMLVFMALALIAILFFLGSAAYQYSQSPKEPAPAQKAPPKEIRLDDLKQWLIEQEKRAKEAPASVPSTGQPKSVEYMEEATALYRCSEAFGKEVGAELRAAIDYEVTQRISDLRVQLEQSADGQDWRKGGWVKAALSFTCTALKDPSIIALRREGKLTKVFMPVIGFHLSAWDRIETEKRKFEQAEQNRVASEKAVEMTRVLAAKALALAHMTAAGIAFVIFMALALYLIFAKIETNLRDINESIRAAGKTSS